MRDDIIVMLEQLEVLVRDLVNRLLTLSGACLASFHTDGADVETTRTLLGYNQLAYNSAESYVEAG